MPRITMEDVARAAGVSRALVSLAYRDRPGVSAETRARILEAGAALGYTPNRIAAQLAGNGGNTLGVFLQDLHNDLFADFYEGIVEVADAGSKEIVLSIGTIDGSRDVAALETLHQLRVDVILVGGLQLDDEAIRALSARVPVVCVFRAVSGVDSVVSDDRFGAVAATQHLLDLGHRRIAFLANPPGNVYGHRREGYEAAMLGAGLQPRVVASSYARHDAARDTVALLDAHHPPTAVFAHNDQAALGALDALALRGLRAGQDVSVVGYDNSSVSRFPGSALTTVDVDGVSLGRSAAEVALLRLDDPAAPARLLNSTPALVVRSTTGPAPQQH
mgnify:CR=1 FL=1